MSFKVDLHTHSIDSPDGGLTLAQYARAFETGLIDCVAVTDHDQIDYALKLRHHFGEHVIVGEEIMSSQGEIIGLFLDEPVLPGLNPRETIRRIKAQGGLVLIPHPFETVRKGLHTADLDKLANEIDLIEVINGRAFLQNRRRRAVVWARINKVVGIANSDAHGPRGLGRTYTQLSALPTRETLVKLCTSGVPVTRHPHPAGLLYPKYHRLRRKLTTRA